jgi:hypothetical protein
MAGEGADVLRAGRLLVFMQIERRHKGPTGSILDAKGYPYLA